MAQSRSKNQAHRIPRITAFPYRGDTRYVVLGPNGEDAGYYDLREDAEVAVRLLFGEGRKIA